MKDDILCVPGSSSEEDDASPREVIQKNSGGSSDFCVRKIVQHSYGRREIEVGGEGVEESETYQDMFVDC
jgi:hypothetical protein